MENNELLKAIRQVVGEVVDEKLEPVNARLDAMQGDLENLHSSMDTMQGDIKGINTRLDTVQGDINGINARLDIMQEDIEIIKEDSAVTRNQVNKLSDWAEQAQIEVKIPLYKRAD